MGIGELQNMKLSYSVKNLRSLENMPMLPLRPITILVGRNSAGKSTFLRSFSLLRQSLEAKSSAPILWYGEYVDFGDFAAAVSFADNKRDISFCFEVSDLTTRSPDDEYTVFFGDYGYSRSSRRRISYDHLKLSVSIGEQGGRTIRKEINLDVPGHGISLRVKFSKDGRLSETYMVNGRELSQLLPGHAVYFSASNLFSSPALTAAAKSDSGIARRRVSPPQAFGARIAEILKPLVDKRIAAENIASESRRILLHPTLNRSSLLSLAKNSNIRSFAKLYERWACALDDEDVKEVSAIISMNGSLVALGRVGNALKDFFVSTTYLGPARARSERYYRFQELEVSEIAPDGQNLPVFLASLSDMEIDNFSSWVAKLFGFGVCVKRDVGHVSIQLKRADFSVNVADTGYGVSQMLPVLAQVWWASRSPGTRRTAFSASPVRPITMEQPELHLHPAHQAKLADALLRALQGNSSARGPSPLFVVETHSEALINRLGELIEEGELNPEDVQVVVFSADQERDSRTSVDTSQFNQDGSLKNWPYGFFNY